MKHTAIGESLTWVDPRTVPGGYNFARHTWTTLSLATKPWALTDGRFCDTHRRIVDRLLRRCRLEGVVAKSSPLAIVGWIAYEPGVCHFMFVQPTFRRMGVGTELVKRVPGARVAMTHWTPALLKFRVPETWTNEPLWFAEHVEVPNGNEEQGQQARAQAAGR